MFIPSFNSSFIHLFTQLVSHSFVHLYSHTHSHTHSFTYLYIQVFIHTVVLSQIRIFIEKVLFRELLTFDLKHFRPVLGDLPNLIIICLDIIPNTSFNMIWRKSPLSGKSFPIVLEDTRPTAGEVIHILICLSMKVDYGSCSLRQVTVENSLPHSWTP